jgi:hypothetical protein
VHDDVEAVGLHPHVPDEIGDGEEIDGGQGDLAQGVEAHVAREAE